jgi:hypothetical protein
LESAHLQIREPGARNVIAVSPGRSRSPTTLSGTCLAPDLTIVSAVSTSIVVSVLVVVWTATRAAFKGVEWTRLTVAQRATLAVAVASTAGLLAWTVWGRPQPQPSDLAPIWSGARALLHGDNPYRTVVPGNVFALGYPLLYPLTAVIAVAPIALLPLRWVDSLFVAAGFGLFAWAITSEKRVAPAAVALVSVPALMALQTSQWSLLLSGAALVPLAGFLLIAKPTIGLAIFAAFPSWKAAVGCAALLVVSVIASPGWIGDWRAGLASAPHVVAPITRPGGLLALLAALRWKRPEARLLLALACVPHTTAPYETIPLFLIPQTWLEAWALWALSGAAYIAQTAGGPYPSQAAYWTSGAQWIVLLMYLPCVALVLSRPNTFSESGNAPSAYPFEAAQLSW